MDQKYQKNPPQRPQKPRPNHFWWFSMLSPQVFFSCAAGEKNIHVSSTVKSRSWWLHIGNLKFWHVLTLKSGSWNFSPQLFPSFSQAQLACSRYSNQPHSGERRVTGTAKGWSGAWCSSISATEPWRSRDRWGDGLDGNKMMMFNDF